MVFGPECKVLCYQVRPVSLVSKHRCLGEGYTHKYVENEKIVVVLLMFLFLLNFRDSTKELYLSQSTQ